MLNWQKIVQVLGGATVVVGALAYIAQGIFTHYLDLSLEKIKSDLESQKSEKNRVHDEVIRWSTPTLAAVVELEDRLNNIQNEYGYAALARDTTDQIKSKWKMSYDYFLPSSVYLFSRYFCTINLIEESLSIEVFKSAEEEHEFFQKIS